MSETWIEIDDDGRAHLVPKTSTSIAERLRALADRPIYSGPDLVELREELRALAAESEAS